MSLSSEQEAAQYLDDFNQWLILNGYDPKFEDIKDYTTIRHVSPKKALDQLRNAYNYFVNGIKGRGATPEISTFGTKRQQPDINLPQNENIKVKDNSNSDFLNNEMEEDKQVNLFDELFTPVKNAKQGKFWKDDKWVNAHQNAFQNVFTQVSGPYEVSYNPNWVRKDYFDYMKENNEKYKDWTRTSDKDYDNDKVNDIVISDDKNKWRYFNGYSLNPKGLDSNNNAITTRGLRQQFILTNPADEDFKTGYLPYLHELPGHEAKPHKVYEQLVNDFLKVLGNGYKALVPKMNTQQKLAYQKSNYKGKLKSLMNRYVVYPTILTGLGLDEATIRKVIFSQPKTEEGKMLRKIYQDKKDTIKNALSTNKQLMTNIGNVIKAVEGKIINDIKSSGNALTFLFELIKGENENINKYFYSSVFEVLNA